MISAKLAYVNIGVKNLVNPLLCCCLKGNGANFYVISYLFFYLLEK